MQEFEVRTQRLRDAESGGEDVLIAVPAARQYEYIFHPGLLRRVILNALSEPVFPPRAEFAG
jgi:hypothetical protein